jgi:peptide/nickel transport system permease protein
MDCVRTARAKGLREKTVIYSHALRNAQITVITALSNWFIAIFGGSLMIERIFLLNGMGTMLYNSVMMQDWGVAFAMNLFYVAIGLVGYLVVDLIYAIADPRIRLT